MARGGFGGGLGGFGGGGGFGGFRFLGGFGNIAGKVVSAIAERGGFGIAAAIGNEAFGEAMGMVGNEGQSSIILAMGPEAFHMAAEAAFAEDDAYGVLEGACAHPEAVSEILGEAAAIIHGYVEEIQGI